MAQEAPKQPEIKQKPVGSMTEFFQNKVLSDIDIINPETGANFK
jgi:hypothetical protein